MFYFTICSSRYGDRKEKSLALLRHLGWDSFIDIVYNDTKPTSTLVCRRSFGIDWIKRQGKSFKQVMSQSKEDLLSIYVQKEEDWKELIDIAKECKGSGPLVIEFSLSRYGSDGNSLTLKQIECVLMEKSDLYLEFCYGMAIHSLDDWNESGGIRLRNLVKDSKLIADRLLYSNHLDDPKLFRSPFDASQMALLIGLDYSIGKGMVGNRWEKLFRNAEDKPNNAFTEFAMITSESMISKKRKREDNEVEKRPKK